MVASGLLLEATLQGAACLARPDARPAPDGEGPLLLAVGDSWVAGAEAPPGASFVDGLATLLPERGVPVRVVNRGRSGANSAHAALSILDHPEPPALAVVLVGQNNATNFARVAEVEERLGRPTPSEPVWERLRTVKLARIVLANLRGGDLTSEAAPPEPPIPPLERDVEGRPVLNAPLLESGPGQRYLLRQGGDTDGLGPGWAALLRTIDRAPVDRARLREALRTATGEEALVLHYALLRTAREDEIWIGVQRHGDFLLAQTTGEAPSVLALVGGAEAALLAGDWRRARRLLVWASNRAPGFADVRDLACRFPGPASSPEVQEACEMEPWQGASTALDRARVADGTLDPAGAAAARRDWLEEHPDDLATRVDLAVWLAHTGDLAGADAVMGYDGDPSAPLPPPVRPTAEHWRYWLLRNAELGDPAAVAPAVELALVDDGASVPLLEAATHVLSEHAQCDALLPLADRWFLLRGDAWGYGAVLAPCLPRHEVVKRQKQLWGRWAPPDAGEGLRALTRAGHEPFVLWERDLDLIVKHVRGAGGEVLLLDYPNPSDDHGALAELVADYATRRGVPYVALRSAFAAEFTPEEWAARLGPNGHCNASGYARMAELVADAVVDRGLLPSSP